MQWCDSRLTSKPPVALPHPSPTTSTTNWSTWRQYHVWSWPRQVLHHRQQFWRWELKTTASGGPGYLSRYSDSLRVGRSGDRIPMEGGEIFRTCPDRPWGPPSLLYSGYRISLQGVKRPGRDVDHPSYLAPKLTFWRRNFLLNFSTLCI